MLCYVMNTPTSLAQVDEPIGVHPGTDSRWPKKLYCTTGDVLQIPPTARRRFIICPRSLRNASRYSTSDCLVWYFRIGVRHFALSTSLAITRYTSLLCPRCNICCFCNLNALFAVYLVTYTQLTAWKSCISIVFWCLLYIVFVCISLSLASE